MSEYQIPTDLRDLAARCAEQMQNDLPPEITGIAAEEVYPLIERIARLESENTRLREALEAADEGIQLAYKVPRPWINGGMSYEEWEKCCQKIDEVQAKVRAALAEKGLI